MSKREANVKLLQNKRRNALNENKETVDVIIDLYASGKMPNYVTAEQIIDRLANKYNRADYIARTEKYFALIVGKYKDAESVKGMLERGRKKGKSQRVSITMILLREKGKDPENEQTAVNVDFAAGTYVASAVAQQKQLREAGKKVRTTQGVEPFYIGSFDLKCNGGDVSYLRSVEHKMLIKKAASTQQGFNDLCYVVRRKNGVFEEMMGNFGDSYLAAVYLMKIAVVDAEGTPYETKRAKHREGEKMAAYYRYTTTDRY